MPVRSPYPDVEIPAVALPEFLFGDGFGADADTPAFVDGVTGASLTFGELHGPGPARRRRARAARDRARGRRRDPRAELAGVAGRCSTACCARTRRDQRQRTEHRRRDRRAAARLRCPADRHRRRAAGLCRGAAAKQAGLGDDAVVVPGRDADGHPSLRDLLACTAEPPAPALDPGDTAVLPYSSGTTGRPKGVILTHRNLVANLAQLVPSGQVEPGDRVLAVLPFFHIYGMTVLMNQVIHRRATAVTLPRFDLAQFLGAIAEHRVQRAWIVPPVAVALAKHPAVDSYDLSSLETIMSGAAPLDAELGRAVARPPGLPGAAGLRHDGAEPRQPLHPGRPARHRPRQHRPAAAEHGGEDRRPGDRRRAAAGASAASCGAAARTSWPATSTTPTRPPRTLDDDGWLHTGDLATVTADGVFTIVDRLKELIKYKGYQVAPAELEAVLLTHDRIADAAVVGVRDADGRGGAEGVSSCRSRERTSTRRR